MNDDAIERARIEALLLEEIEGEAWETYCESGARACFAFWHEGAPDWYDGEAGAEYRTAVVFGFSGPPKLAGWVCMGAFGLGERECPWCGPGLDERPAVGSECPLCECPVEAGRGGFIYLGEDCAEAVYRRRQVGPRERAYLTEDGFRLEVYDGGTLDWGLRILNPAGEVAFDAPHFFSLEAWGFDCEDDACEPWSTERWQEALEAEADDLVSLVSDADSGDASGVEVAR